MQRDDPPSRTADINPPLVAVIIPAHNAAATILEALDSAITQTEKRLQIIVVDDGSTDQTRELVTNIQQSDKRVQLLSQHNQGVSAARNSGLKVVQARYVAFLDADDKWLPNKLEIQLTFMQSTGATFTFTAYRKFSTQRLYRQRDVPQVATYNTLLVSRPINTSSVVFDTTALTLNWPELPRQSGLHEDLLLWLRLSKTTMLYGIKDDLCRVRIGRESRSSNKAKSALNVWRIYRTHEHLTFVRASTVFVRYAFNALLSYEPLRPNKLS